MLAISIMEYLLPNLMNRVLHRIEFWRIGGHQVKTNINGGLDGILGKQICQKVLHLCFVRGVAVKKNIQADKASCVIVPNHLGKVCRHIKRLRLWRSLKKNLRSDKINTQQAIGALSFFSLVFTVGRVFFGAQP